MSFCTEIDQGTMGQRVALSDAIRAVLQGLSTQLVHGVPEKHVDKPHIPNTGSYLHRFVEKITVVYFAASLPTALHPGRRARVPRCAATQGHHHGAGRAVYHALALSCGPPHLG